MKSIYRQELDKIDSKQKIIEMSGLGLFCMLPVLMLVVSKYVPIDFTPIISACVIVVYFVLATAGIYFWHLLEESKEKARKLMNDLDLLAEEIADDVFKKMKL
jgi:hypothetical protein